MFSFGLVDEGAEGSPADFRARTAPGGSLNV